MRCLRMLATLSLAARIAGAATVTEVHYVMGTYFRVAAEHADPAQARRGMRACFAAARQLDEQLSRFDPSSEISRLNATASTPGAVMVSVDLAALLRRALALQTQTHGTFDVSVGALTQLWRTSAAWPGATSIATARETAGTQSIVLSGSTLVRRPGVIIDVDGIAKGWAVDRCVLLLRAAGIERALLNFGESSLYAMGAPRGTRGWRVIVRGLDDETAIGTLTLRDAAVSVSSVFGHAREIGAKRVGHIVDPRTGQALTVPATSVIVSTSATDAEAFSKAVLIEPAILAHRRAAVIGALRITRGDIWRTGAIPFAPFRTPRPIAVAAEALR